jgi:hypothetical protein
LRRLLTKDGAGMILEIDFAQVATWVLAAEQGTFFIALPLYASYPFSDPRFGKQRRTGHFLVLCFLRRLRRGLRTFATKGAHKMRVVLYGKGHEKAGQQALAPGAERVFGWPHFYGNRDQLMANAEMRFARSMDPKYSYEQQAWFEKEARGICAAVLRQDQIGWPPLGPRPCDVDMDLSFR